MRRTTGQYVMTSISGEEVRAFVPKPLPPVPPLSFSGDAAQLLGIAERKIAELRIASELVPNTDLFGYAFVRKEAIFSSQIEGVQATLSDLLNYEAAPEEFRAAKDILEVCNYLEALHYGKKQLADSKGLPLSLRLIREIHKRLMKNVRGASKNPGEFRTTQNWIGGSRPGNAHFVPPPPGELNRCLGDFEKFLHADESSVHPLIKIGLIHVQFETIHPFLDGNGRLGRLLIGLLMENWLGLDARLLYLSFYFKKYQQQYYRHLDHVRADGDWGGWIQFFLEGVSKMAEEAVATARSLFRVLEQHRKKLLSTPDVIVPAVRLFEQLPNHPVLTISNVVKLLKTTKPTAGKAVGTLVNAGILKETTGAKRNRLFGYQSYLNLLKKDT